MNVLVEYVFDKEEIETLIAVCEYALEEYDSPESIRALKHMLEPLQVSREVLSCGNERKG